MRDVGKGTDRLILDHGVSVIAHLNGYLYNAVLAQRFGVDEVTIKAKLNRLYKQFGINTRLQLLSVAIAQGIVTRGAGAD